MTLDVQFLASDAKLDRETVPESSSPRAIADSLAGESYVAKDEM
jgi:hypothetical protein